MEVYERPIVNPSAIIELHEFRVNLINEHEHYMIIIGNTFTSRLCNNLATIRSKGQSLGLVNDLVQE